MSKVIIIGAGVSGLSAGIYALQSGFEVEIYEKHFITGGACTSWFRKGYTFEGSVHWLTGSAKGSPFYKVWEEVGVLSEGVKTFRHDPYNALDYEGQRIYLYRDPKKLRAHFLEISPQDKAVIDRLYKDIRALSGMTMPIMDEKGVKLRKKSKSGLGMLLKILPAIGKFKRLAAQSCSEYAAAFSHHGLRAIVETAVPKEYNAIALISVMATFASDGHFPQGGALGLAGRMTEKFKSLGGLIHLSTPVEKVSIKNGRADGIIVKGEHIKADAVIVTRDILTVDSLFNNPPKDEWIKKLRETDIPQLCTFIGIGARADLSDLPHQLYFKPETPVICAGKELPLMVVINYAHHPEYAPEGCVALTAFYTDDTYDWWAKAKAEGRYEDEKKALAKQVTNALIKKIPKLDGNIEVIDVATPLTYERYTGSYKGSWMSITPKNTMPAQTPLTCEGIEGLYFAGFRTQAPGGLPVALSSGRRAAQLICKQFDVVFQGKMD